MRWDFLSHHVRLLTNRVTHWVVCCALSSTTFALDGMPPLSTSILRTMIQHKWATHLQCRMWDVGCGL